MEKFCIVILVFQILKPMRKYIKEVCKLDLRFGYERNRLNFSGAWGRIWIILSLVLISPFSIAQNQQIANSEFYTEASFCQIDQIQTPSTIIPFIGRDSSNMPFQLEADQIDVPVSGKISLDGNASVIQGAKAIYADHIMYGKDDRVIEAMGNVVMHTSNGDRIEASALQLDFETQIGYANEVSFKQADAAYEIFRCGDQDCYDKNIIQPLSLAAPVSVLRGYAQRAYFDGHDRQRLNNVRLSRCPEGDDSVVLVASQVVLDHGTGEATGRDLSVRFFDTPILYFPILTFPISDERKTGFLFPSFGFGGDYGFRLVTPYYWNIAPNRDATITTDHMTSRGTLFRGEYRYLGETTLGGFNGRVGAEFIDSDRKFGDKRYGATLFHQQQFGKYWSSQLDLGYVSDRDYLDDFGDTLGADSADHVPQSFSAEYRRSDQVLPDDDLNIGVLFSDYQIIDPLIQEKHNPYARLPELSLNWKAKLWDQELQSELNASWTRFEHAVPSKVAGSRLNLRPSILFQQKERYGFTRSRVDLDLISYNLNERLGEYGLRPSLVVPVISLDSGLIFERTGYGFGNYWLQTLEPRAYYAYVPYVNQDDQPLFDDNEFELDSMSKYFSPNRFHRTDRVGDTNRITLGLSTRLIQSRSGKQRLQGGVAQMFYLDQRRVREDPSLEPMTNRYSNLFGEISVNLTDRLSSSLDSVWNWNDKQILSTDVNLDYENHRSHISLSYRLNPSDSKEQLISDLEWPFLRNWLVGVENIYSIRNKTNLQTGLSVGYDACCWATQFKLDHKRKEITGSWEGKTNFIFQIELRDLGRISSSALGGISAGLGLN